MLSKQHRLSSRGAVWVIRRGARLSGPTLRLKWYPAQGAISRATVVAGLPFDKRATKRNLIKRRLREALHPFLPQLNPPVNCMIFVSRRTSSRSMRELREELSALLRRARLLS